MIIRLNDVYCKIHYDKRLNLFYVNHPDYREFVDKNIHNLYERLKKCYSVFIPFPLHKIEAINFQKFLDAIGQGYDYLINKVTGELHKLSVDNFDGSHNLAHSNFDNFIFAMDIGNCKIENLPEGTEVPFYDFETGKLFSYKINKCRHCYPCG